MYNDVDKNYDVIIPYTHNTAHVIILPLEIIVIIHYTIHLTYNTFNNHLLREGYALLNCFSFLNVTYLACVSESISITRVYSHILLNVCVDVVSCQ